METLKRLLPPFLDGAWTGLVLLFFASALPVFVAWALLAWKRPKSVPLPFLLSVILGILTIPFALLMTFITSFLFEGPLAGAPSVFLHTPLGEELGRLAVFSLFLLPVAGLECRRDPSRSFASAAILAALLAGMAFSAVETAMYAPKTPLLLLLRAGFSWPVHAACSVFVARAVLALRVPEGRGGWLRILWFPAAVLVHAAWNASLLMPQLFVPFTLSCGCMLLVFLALKKGR